MKEYASHFKPAVIVALPLANNDSFHSDVVS